MDQYDYIRTAHRVYGKAIKELARETGHSKNTIKKILKQEYIGYKQRSKQPYPVLGPLYETLSHKRGIVSRWFYGFLFHNTFITVTN